VGPFETLATPGHAPDHVALVAARALFTGDTVLGTGSVFIQPGEGSLAAYLDSLRRLRELDVEAILPGHGPVVWDPRAKLDEYIEHRLDRERRVLDALAGGARTHDELLDSAWADVDLAAQPYLRFAAAATLEAPLEKLAEEGRLPAGVERAG
jgi:glyoxylase-like metal-dependent hydrolase (beta-lactamase superfamily II)